MRSWKKYHPRDFNFIRRRDKMELLKNFMSYKKKRENRNDSIIYLFIVIKLSNFNAEKESRTDSCQARFI